MKNVMFNENYYFVQKVTHNDINYGIYAPYCNINFRYIVEFKIPKVDILDECPPEYVTIMIQFNDANSLDYQIRNVYYHMRNYKAERFVSKYRKILDNIIPLIKR